MTQIPLMTSPGIHSDVSPYAAGKSGGFYVDGLNVRWVKSFLAARGGSSNGPVNVNSTGEVRDVFFWQDNKGETFIAVGTTSDLYLVYNDTAYSILPSSITLTGRDTYAVGLGWSTGGWSEGTWSTPRPESNTADFDPVQWSFANFGEDLLIVLRNGEVLYWDRSAWTNQANPPDAVELNSLANEMNTPDVGRDIIVTSPDRHIMIAGADPIDALDSIQQPLLVRWGARQSLTDFNPDENDTGGDILLTEGNTIMAMLATQQQNLVFTDYALYTMNYVSDEVAYAPELIGTNCGAVSKNAVADVNGAAFWLADDDFYMYNGGMAQPIPCSVKYRVLDEINEGDKKLVFAGVNPEFNEVSWFYKSGSVQKYASYNYKEQWWTLGENDIRAWSDTGGIYDKPVSFTATGQMQFEEQPGEPVSCFAETAPFELAAVAQGEEWTQGDHKLMYMRRFIPDFHYLNGGMQVTVSGRKYPGAEMQAKPSFTVYRNTQKHDIKLRVRQLKLRFAADSPFQSGTHRVDCSPDGSR